MQTKNLPMHPNVITLHPPPETGTENRPFPWLQFLADPIVYVASLLAGGRMCETTTAAVRVFFFTQKLCSVQFAMIIWLLCILPMPMWTNANNKKYYEMGYEEMKIGV